MKRRITTVLLLLLIILSNCSSDSAFEGLSNDSSEAADLEKAALAIDDADYETAITILSDRFNEDSPDPDVARLLASAYMGKAGIDAITLLENSTDQTYSAFDYFSTSLDLEPVPEFEGATCSAEDRTVLIIDTTDNYYALYIDWDCVSDLIELLTTAQDILRNLDQSGASTDDDKIKLGIISAAHFILSVGKAVTIQIFSRYDYVYQRIAPGEGPVPINKDAYRIYQIPASFLSVYDWSKLTPNAFVEKDETGKEIFPKSYQQDMIDLKNAVDAFIAANPEQSEICDRIETLLLEVLNQPEEEITDELILETLTPERLYAYLDGFTPPEEPEEPEEPETE
ncbi:MAG: hypothetical protein ACP5G0_11435 [Desulfomonilia bacterium]